MPLGALCTTDEVHDTLVHLMRTNLPCCPAEARFPYALFLLSLGHNISGCTLVTESSSFPVFLLRCQMAATRAGRLFCSLSNFTVART